MQETAPKKPHLRIVGGNPNIKRSEAPSAWEIQHFSQQMENLSKDERAYIIAYMDLLLAEEALK